MSEASNSTTSSTDSQQALLEAVKAAAESSGAFGPVSLSGTRVTCEAAASAEPAEYRVDVADSVVAVSLVTDNRWLSESIESDLVHTGDKMDELLDEELAEFDWTHGTLKIEHYRSDDMLFTFRSPLPAGLSHKDIATVLFAYEACFSQLGDMSEGENAD